MKRFESLRQQVEALVGRYERKRAAILPVLHFIQERIGYINTDAEEWVANLLGISPAHVHEVVTFYTMFNRHPVGKYHVQVCRNIACCLRGAEDRISSLKEKLGINPGETTPDGRYTFSTVECLCACEQGPVMQVNNRYIGPITEGSIELLINSSDTLSEMPLAFRGAVGLVERILTKRFNFKDSELIQTYGRDGGYEAARKALTSMTPEQVIAEVAASNLRGLGGAGFPTGKKWSFIPKDSKRPKYLVVNADEGEPGTIKDRYIIEKDPHRLLEGALIAAYATGCRKAYIYVRGEYVRPWQILQHAIDEAYDNKILGERIFNTDFSLEVAIHRGAGAYICGEETALLSSLEGNKGYPKLKPPFPAIEGLFGCPTVINNVETLSCIPTIIEKGSEYFAKLGFGRSGGTRLFSLSGHIQKPGLYEAPQGIKLSELIEASGGVPEGRTLKAVIPGGISAKILRSDELDVNMEFDSMLQAGTMAGSAGVIVMDDTTCMVKVLWYAAKFFAHESCGQCSPCREGTGWAFKIIDRIAHGKGRAGDLEILLKIASNMEGRTICVFADAAAWPIQSYITKFRDEFEYHIREKRCNLRQQSAEQLAGIHD